MVASSVARADQELPAPCRRRWSLGVLAPTARHPDVTAEVIEELPHLSGNLIHDANTAILMREHGVQRTYTRDTDFHRFPFVEPVDPIV